MYDTKQLTAAKITSQIYFTTFIIYYYVPY